MTFFFSVDGISKSYPGVKANDKISFGLEKGEIHALLGENGSGKSTLVKTMYGLVHPDEGRMEFQGSEYAPSDPNAARAAGIAMVFQHFSLFDALTVSENIALGMDDAPSTGQLSRLITETGGNYGLPLRPDRRVGDLSAGERQRVEIIRCLLPEPKLLIMDEPTSVLTPQEVDILFETLRKLSKEGTTILYISHKLEEIRALCDSATILRAGKVVATCEPETKTARQLAEMMVGSSFKSPARTSDEIGGEPVLRVEGLSVPSPNLFGVSLDEVSFTVRSKEILGIGGIAGNGQEELVAALSGELAAAAGQILINGEDVCRAGPTYRRKRGLLTAPEERLGHAAAPEMTLVENAYMTGFVTQDLLRRGFVRWSKAAAFAQTIVERFDVRTPGVENTARSLSGGNLQKFVIGREILQNPRALVVNQPTWGVDAAAASSIRQALLDLAARGSAVVVISQDLDELIEISGTIAVLNDGKLSEERPAEQLTRDEIGLMMGGAHDLAQPQDQAFATA